MTDTPETREPLALSDGFDGADEALWRAAAEKALNGRPVDRLSRAAPGDPAVRALYRETDWPSATDPLGAPGAAPFARGATGARDPHSPWDIRQAFTHPDPAVTNAEILRDLERGVSSVELKLDSTGRAGCAVRTLAEMKTALDGVRADIATVALDHGDGSGCKAAALLGLWAETQDTPRTLRLAFNLDPLGGLARLGVVEGGLDAAVARCAALSDALALRFPLSTTFRIDARMVHDSGGSAAQELAALIASGVDTLRRLEACGAPADRTAPKMTFGLAVDANYGAEIAKLRAARRLWARVREALGLPAEAMVLQAVSSARMLTRYDPWVNLLRNTAACFAAAAGGADIVTVRPFTEALGVPEELGRRTARNTQIIAQEESQLGRVADPAGGAWFMEAHADALAEAAWAEFQKIESEGGFGASLMADAFQARVAEVRAARMREVATRKAPVTGVSEYPTLDEIDAPTAEIDWSQVALGEVSDEGLRALIGAQAAAEGEDDLAEPFWPLRLSEPYQRLRDHAAARARAAGEAPCVFLATLGPLAEHTARADYARNFFAAGGLGCVIAPKPPETLGELASAFRASTCRLAVICGSDARYAEDAADAANALKAAGAQRVYLAGRPGENEAAWREAGVDSFIHIGVDVVAALELAHAELGLS